MVLIIEDDETDEAIIRRVLAKATPEARVVSASDGNGALLALRSDSLRQDIRLILLDLQLPKVSGLEVLERLHADPGIHGVPIVVLSSSSRPADVQEAYRLGARSFVVKPIDFAEYTEMLKHAVIYWLKFNRRPGVAAMGY